MKACISLYEIIFDDCHFGWFHIGGMQAFFYGTGGLQSLGDMNSKVYILMCIALKLLGVICTWCIDGVI